MDRHEEKEAKGEKERLVAHFSPELCIHTASSCCSAALMFKYLFMLTDDVVFQKHVRQTARQMRPNGLPAAKLLIGKSKLMSDFSFGEGDVVYLRQT